MHHPRLRSFGLMVALVSLLGGGLVPVLAVDGLRNDGPDQATILGIELVPTTE